MRPFVPVAPLSFSPTLCMVQLLALSAGFTGASQPFLDDRSVIGEYSDGFSTIRAAGGGIFSSSWTFASSGATLHSFHVFFFVRFSERSFPPFPFFC